MSNLTVLALLTTVLLLQSTNATLTSVAWFYGDTIPTAALSKFQVVVVNPDTINPTTVTGTTKYFCYISIGEVAPFMPYYKKFPKAWIMGTNSIWNTSVIDLTASGYANFFAVNVTGPLWKAGFRGFFIDTMDSYQLYRSGAAAAAQVAAEANIIKVLKTHYPTAELIYNRGFEIYPKTYDLVYAVAFESLTKTFSNKYGVVSAGERNDLLESIAMIRKYTPNKPIISIDYCPPTNVTCQDQALAGARAHSLNCYVSDINLSKVGRST